MRPHALHYTRGRVAEWLNAPVLKTGIGESLSGVRIPPRPPFAFLVLVGFYQLAQS